MADLLVTCVDTSSRSKTHQNITHLGGPKGPDGKDWRWTRAAVIDYIEAGTHSFHTVDRRRFDIAHLRVVRTGDEPAYLQTFCDNEPTDNLLEKIPCTW